MDDPLNVISCPGIPDARTINVVATYSLLGKDPATGRLSKIRINLARLAKVVRNVPVKYSPSNFAAVILYFESKPETLKKTTVLMFSTGNIVHTGATSEWHALRSAHYFVGFLNKNLGINAYMNDFVVVNIVATVDNVGFKVDVKELGKNLGSRATYEPEGKNGFPACRIRSVVDRKKQVSLVCFSGSVVITGCRTREDIRINQKNVYEECLPFAVLGSGSSMNKAQYMLKKRKDEHARLNSNVPELNKRLKYVSERSDAAYEDTTRSFAIGTDGNGRSLEWPGEGHGSSSGPEKESDLDPDLSDLLTDSSALERLLSTADSDARGPGLDYQDLANILSPCGVPSRPVLPFPHVDELGTWKLDAMPRDPKVDLAERLYASEFEPDVRDER